MHLHASFVCLCACADSNNTESKCNECFLISIDGHLWIKCVFNCVAGYPSSWNVGGKKDPTRSRMWNKEADKSECDTVDMLLRSACFQPTEESQSSRLLETVKSSLQLPSGGKGTALGCCVTGAFKASGSAFRRHRVGLCRARSDCNGTSCWRHDEWGERFGVRI